MKKSQVSFKDKDHNKESNIVLPDGRTLFTTNNGFKYFVKDKKGEITEVTEEYWITTKRNNMTKRAKKAHNKL